MAKVKVDTVRYECDGYTEKGKCLSFDFGIDDWRSPIPEGWGTPEGLTYEKLYCPVCLKKEVDRKRKDK